MKKIVITLLLFVSFATSFGQGKYQERQNTYFVEAAAKEFDLDKNQQKELSEFRMEMVKAFMTTNKSFKAGDITKEIKKEKNREASKTFNSKMVKLTGKPYAELKDWMAKMRKELKEVK